MRIIITGGTGLIGSALASSLAQDGHDVIALSRTPSRYPFPSGVRGEGWDGRSAKGWGVLADGADAIVNLAGASVAGEGALPQRWTPERKQLIHDSRVQAGQAVLEAIEAATQKPRVLIQSSAVGFYGPRGDEILTEDSRAGNDFLAQVTIDWEASTAVVPTLGVRNVIIRTGVVLSPTGGALPSMMLPFKLFAGGPLGSGKQWVPWIHLVDEVRAIRFLLEHESANGVFNLTAPNPLTNRELSQILGKVMKRPSFMPTPAFAFNLLFGEVATIVLDGQRALPKRLEALGFTFQFPQVQAALMDLLS